MDYSSSPLKDVRQVANRVSTGIRIIDELLGGGLEKGSSVLLRSSPFVDAVPVAQEWLFNRLSQGDRGLYLVNNKAPDVVLEQMRNYGWRVKPFLDRGTLKFIDAYSGILGVKSSDQFCVGNPLDAEEISRMILNAFKEEGKGTTAFFDSLNTMIDQCGADVISHVEEWCKYGVVYDVSSVYLYTEWGYPEKITSKIEEIFDTVIDLKAIKRIVASEVLTVTKVDGKVIKERRFLPFRYARPGGLRIYVPKILVTGPYHAGKTTVVHQLSTRAVSVQRMGTTVALDFGHAEHKGFSVDLFGTIGQPRFDPILDVLGGEALGVMLVVDSTKPEEFPRAMEMIHKAGVHGLPYVVLANKQDLPGALSPDEVRERMHIPDDMLVVGTVATEKKNLIEALDALLRKISGED